MILSNNKHKLSVEYNLRGKYCTLWCPVEWLRKQLKEHEDMHKPDLVGEYINISFVVDKVTAGDGKP